MNDITDVSEKLLNSRIIKLTGTINEESADKIIDKLLYLDYENNDEIYFYINSYGGSVHAALSIYDVMQNIKSPVSTIGLGKCMSAGAFLLSVGNPKKRYAFPSCTIMMHQMATNFGYNQTDELHVRMTEHDRLNKLYISILAKHMKKSEECVVDLMRNTNYMGINKALDLGIIDCVLNSEIKPTITRLI